MVLVTAFPVDLKTHGKKSSYGERFILAHESHDSSGLRELFTCIPSHETKNGEGMLILTLLLPLIVGFLVRNGSTHSVLQVIKD